MKNILNLEIIEITGSFLKYRVVKSYENGRKKIWGEFECISDAIMLLKRLILEVKWK